MTGVEAGTVWPICFLFGEWGAKTMAGLPQSVRKALNASLSSPNPLALPPMELALSGCFKCPPPSTPPPASAGPDRPAVHLPRRPFQFGAEEGKPTVKFETRSGQRRGPHPAVAIGGKTFGQSGPTSQPRGHPSWLAKFGKLSPALIYAWGAAILLGMAGEWNGLAAAEEEHWNGHFLTSSPKRSHQHNFGRFWDIKKGTQVGPEIVLVFSISGR